jgi:hypothetical protein
MRSSALSTLSQGLTIAASLALAPSIARAQTMQPAAPAPPAPVAPAATTPITTTVVAPPTSPATAPLPEAPNSAPTPQPPGIGDSSAARPLWQTNPMPVGAAGVVTPPTTPDGNPPDPGYDVVGTPGARAVGLAPPGTNYSNFMDTRLSWTFGDDDFLHPTGQLIPLSPTFSIGDRQQYRLFFDSLNSQYAGRENLTHLVMYKKMPGFIPRLTTEAAVVLRFDLTQLAANNNNINQALYDAGSYIRISYQTGKSAKEGLSATFFPLDTDRFRLGYLYDISWGGTNANLNQSIFPGIQGSSPGLKVQYDAKDYYAFLGFKTAMIVQPEQILNPGGTNQVQLTNIAETNYGFLGGLGVDAAKFLRLDAGAGYFQQGKQNIDDVRGDPVYTYGASGRLVVHKDMPVPQSVDFLLYKNDPNAPMIMFAPQKYDPREVAWSVSAEVDLLEQHLKNFDVSGAVTDQFAYAAALQAVGRIGYWRLSATGITRDLNYVVRNVPGFIPFETMPQNAKTDPEIFGALAADYYIPSLRLTPGIGGGIQLPSTFKSEFTDGGVPASRTVVVRSQGNESILPYDSDRTPIYQARLSLRWNISEILSAVGWVQFIRDNNGTLVVQDPTEGTASLRVFQSPNQLGAAISLQARY